MGLSGLSLLHRSAAGSLLLSRFFSVTGVGRKHEAESKEGDICKPVKI